MRHRFAVAPLIAVIRSCAFAVGLPFIFALPIAVPFALAPQVAFATAPPITVPFAVAPPIVFATTSSPTTRPELVVERIEGRSGFLTVTFSARNLFTPRIVETLDQGLPATLDYELQLWKKRSVWFDKLVSVNQLSYRVIYDPWDAGFRIETVSGSSPGIFDLEHVERSLCLHVSARVGDLALMEPLATHYVVIRATLKLLSPRDIDEVETWLSERGEKERRGVTAIPGYLFNLIVGLSGFGDEAVNVKSELFRLDGKRLLSTSGQE